MFIKTDLPPGHSRRGTLYQTQGRWYGGSHVRWANGGMTPIGGWDARTVTPLNGSPRAMAAWRANDGTRFYAVGTNTSLYVATPTLTDMVDITPSGFSPGYADATAGGGYGVGNYGAGAYGTPRVDADGIAQEASVWTLDTWGQYLVGCMSDDGKLYEWQLDISTPTRAAPILNAPTACRGLVTTPEAFLVALGAGGNGRKVQWCDRGNNTVWAPDATNQARDYTIQSPGRLMCGQRVRTLTLLFTELDVHAMIYQGLPNVYVIDRVGENCGVISRGAVVAPDTRAFWMSQGGFFVFDGAAVSQLPCDVYDAVFGDMNFTQRSKVTAVLDTKYGEAWWFYPSAASLENDRAVVFNYREGHFTLHTLARLSGVDRGIYTNPMRCGADGIVYDHETGTDWDGVTPSAESGPLEDGAGDRIVKVRDVILDERTQGDVVLYVKAKEWNNDADQTFGPFSAPNPIDAHFAGRALRMVVEFQGAGQFGAPRFDAIAGGRR